MGSRSPSQGSVAGGVAGVSSRSGGAGQAVELAAAHDRVPAYRSVPARGRGAGVVVVHEGDGLRDFTRDVCDRLARAGLVALAPDLFRGATAADAASARALLSALEPERAGLDLDAAVADLLAHHAVDGPRVGVVGFCAGGALALWLAGRNPRVGAAACFYGALPQFEPDFDTMGAAVLGIFAEKDETLPLDAGETLASKLEAAGVRHRVIYEPRVGHGFMNETRADVFDAAAAERGWDLLLATLRSELT